VKYEGSVWGLIVRLDSLELVQFNVKTSSSSLNPVPQACMLISLKIVA
jgi:hypothetical protein